MVHFAVWWLCSCPWWHSFALKLANCCARERFGAIVPVDLFCCARFNAQVVQPWCCYSFIECSHLARKWLQVGSVSYIFTSQTLPLVCAFGRLLCMHAWPGPFASICHLDMCCICGTFPVVCFATWRALHCNFVEVLVVCAKFWYSWHEANHEALLSAETLFGGNTLFSRKLSCHEESCARSGGSWIAHLLHVVTLCDHVLLISEPLFEKWRAHAEFVGAGTCGHMGVVTDVERSW